mgnify:CR=1 FL=1
MIYTTNGRGRLYDNILQTVGDTPTIRLNRIAPKGVDIYVKFEAFNPAGSVKDRLALNIIEAAEREGRLKPGQTVVEATSGNTGIGLAMVCAQKGYPLVITMAENFSIERRKMIRFLGAQVILTPASDKGSGMVAKADELAKENISVEIIDLRTVRPLDHDTIIESVKKTNRLIILEEAWPFGSVSTEITYRIQDEAFDYLDAPIKRITTADTPAPYSPVLLEAWIPNSKDVIKAVKEVLKK